MLTQDLNRIWVKDDVGFGGPVDHSCQSDNKLISVYFRQLKANLISHIHEFPFVFGCVAWLTDVEILNAMSTRDCQIVVQKEDFLRPDLDSENEWKSVIRQRYSSLSCPFIRDDFGATVALCDRGGDPTIDPVRCVGNHNSSKHPSQPRMHNKFLLFGYAERKDEPPLHNIYPQAVWTGSFNFSKNAGRSLENALYITDPAIVWAYFHEYRQILTISESLDWTSEWCAPEWRIGS